MGALLAAALLLVPAPRAAAKAPDLTRVITVMAGLRDCASRIDGGVRRLLRRPPGSATYRDSLKRIREASGDADEFIRAADAALKRTDLLRDPRPPRKIELLSFEIPDSPDAAGVRTAILKANLCAYQYSLLGQMTSKKPDAARTAELEAGLKRAREELAAAAANPAP